MFAISNIIWVNSDAKNEEQQKFLKELEPIWYLKIKSFKNIKEAIDYIKIIEFVETKIIVNGELYIEFINHFINNLNELNVIPKIIIFTKQKDLFINYHKQYEKIINNPFYNFDGIKTTFEEIKQFLISPQNNKKPITDEDNIQMTFEYIDKIEKLALPLFYKSLIELTPDENIDKYTKYIYEKYSNNKYMKELFDQIKSLKNIPIELLSKYYIRAYTIESNFYKDINKDLGFKKKESHLSFIKALYEGSKLKSLPLASNNILYRGSKISKSEIEKIKYYLKNKIKDLPAAIVFSNSFLSFSKDKNVAEGFLNKINVNNKISKVLYILEKDDNIDYSLSSHSDIEKISFYPNEKEVLFFPFSSFEIKNIKENIINGEKSYVINLLYLGKYLKETEKNKLIIEKENIIPNSEFKNQIIDYGLIKPKKITNNNTKKLFNSYLKYKNDINNNIHKTNLKNNNIGANNSIINNSNIQKIKLLAQNIDKDDEIMKLFFKLYNKGLVSDIIDIKHEGKIVAKKFMISQQYLKKDYNLIEKNWIPAWHGTKIKNIESIIKYGLKKPGTKLSNTEMTPEPQYGYTDKEIDHIQNWSDAIFASPKIYIASYYSERITTKDGKWACLIDVKIRPYGFTKHKSGVLLSFTIHTKLPDSIDDSIYRISSEDDIIL